MGITIFLAAPALIIIGIVSTYTDLKYGRIPNWLIIFGLVYAIGLYVFLFGYNAFFVHQAINGEYIAKALQNIAIALVSGIVLWKFDLWSAGDAKLFTVYAALLPLEAYSNGYVEQFPAFNLLVNLFFPLVVILAVKALLFAFRSVIPLIKNGAWRESIKVKEMPAVLKKGGVGLAKLFGDYFFMYLIFQIVGIGVFKLSGGAYRLDPFIMYFGILLFMGKFNELKRKIKHLSAGIYVISSGYLSYLLITGQYSTLRRMIIMAFVFMVLITITRKVLDLYIQKAEMKEVRISELTRGMIIRKEEISAIRNELTGQGREEEFGWFEPGGVKESQIAIIKDVFSDRQDTILKVYKTFPFAPFLSLSVILTMTTGISVLRVFQYFIK
jgi:hypothetical protein